jgi:hypothetical protein
MDVPAGAISDEDRYLFDLRGYLVLPGVLDAAELAGLNATIDQWRLPEPGDHLKDQLFGGYLLWSKAFRDLLDHPRVLPYLTAWVGPHVRLDRYYGIYMRPGTSGLPLHGGPMEEHEDEAEYYRFHRGRPYNGITTVSWALTDMLPGQGGFVCVPGSHKGNYPLPEHFDHTAECAVQVPLRAGDVVLFTGAVTHGTYPWTGPHQRRTLIFKYAPAHLAWGPGYLDWPPELRAALTPRQADLLAPPMGTPHDHADTRPAYMSPVPTEPRA